MTQKPKDWSQVDEGADKQQYIQTLSTLSNLQQMQGIQKLIFELLSLKEGSHVLDVGCGLGDDVLALAEFVGSTGRAVGIDNSSSMIEEARKKAENLSFPVEFYEADLMQLNFPDASFDACSVKRVLIHLKDPKGAIREMIRVLRSGGKLVCFERDAETLLIDANDQSLTRKVASGLQANFPRTQMGRQLYALFVENGLQAVKAYPETSILTEFSVFEQLLEIRASLEQLVSDGIISQEQSDTWLAEQQERGQTGRFFFAMTGFAVSGTKA